MKHHLASTLVLSTLLIWQTCQAGEAQREADVCVYGGTASGVMAALAAGILLTGFAFTRIPGGFVPIEDQGYAIGFVQAPEGVSN
ncbi:MAG: hypothetical protein ACPG4K_09430, partial [Haloferula sp.]